MLKGMIEEANNGSRLQRPKTRNHYVVLHFMIQVATWLAQLVERQTAMLEVEVSSPRPDQHSGYKIPEENVLPLQ